jgi:two-component system sensor histidine kinase RpfC
LTQASQSSEGIVLKFEVKDTGVGIRKEFLPRIFDRFAQDDIGSARQQGTGLGTTISKQLVEAMGGVIDVSSEPGKGTTFWLEIPFRFASECAMPIGRNELADWAATAAAKGRILVADDNSTNRTIMFEILTSAGHTVITAVDGMQALDLLEHDSFDLALLDLRMPYISGMGVCERYKRLRPNDQETKFVLLSADLNNEDFSKAKAAGFDDCFAKPIEAMRLLHAIDSVLKGSPASSSHNLGAGDQENSRHRSAVIVDAEGFRKLIAAPLSSKVAAQASECFKKDVGNLIRRIDEDLAGERLDLVPDHAHAIAGCAATLAATAMHDEARRILEIAKTNSRKLSSADLAQLKSLYEATCLELARLTAQPPMDSAKEQHA